MKEGMRTRRGAAEGVTVCCRSSSSCVSSDPQASVFYTPATRCRPPLPTRTSAKLKPATAQAIAVKLESLALDRLAPSWKRTTCRPAAARPAMARCRTAPPGTRRVAQQHQPRPAAGADPRIGLKEVARIQGEIREAGARSWATTARPPAFPQWVAAQPKFKPFKTEQQVLERYRQLYAQSRPSCRSTSRCCRRRSSTCSWNPN
jgi:uncharacterized protein (DUF885 family)